MQMKTKSRNTLCTKPNQTSVPVWDLAHKNMLRNYKFNVKETYRLHCYEAMQPVPTARNNKHISIFGGKISLRPGLAFVTYPEAISMLPLPHLWAILFFVMLYLLGMDSCFVQIEAIMSSVTDEYPVLRKHKKIVTLASCFVMFLGSLSCITNGGMYVLQLLDWYCASISVILICSVEVISIAWIYGCENFCQDIEFMMDEKVQIWWKICWKYITPCILMFIFVTTILFNTRISYNNIEYPDWAIAMGWMSAVSSMILIPGYAIYKIFLTGKGSIYQRLVKNLKASSEWGPALPENRAAWKEHILSNTNR